MTSPDARSDLLHAIQDVALRTTTTEFRRLVAWVRRAARDGSFPPGVSYADVLDLQLAVLRRGRCPVPGCSFKSSIAREPGSNARGEPDRSNPYRLCRAHRRLEREGWLAVVGLHDSPSFFTRDGQPIRLGGGAAPR